MKFHIIHCLHPVHHGLLGYSEVIETLEWGLTQLGHDVTVAVNTASTDRINIVLGGQILSPDQIISLPPGAVFYHLEQIARVPLELLRPSLRAIASNFQIWDYNDANIQALSRLNPRFPPKLLPISHAPLLRRIVPADQEDIEVLFYGITSPSRMAVFDELCRAAIKCVFACGLYGEARDSLIARAKLVLNLNVYEQSRIFEIVRVSYLLANEKAVVSDIYPDSIIEPDMRQAVGFAEPQKILELCRRLLADDVARRALASRGRETFEQRDIRENLRPLIRDIAPSAS